MSRAKFHPSFYSNPGALEPATLIISRGNPREKEGEGGFSSSTVYKWEAKDGTVVELDGTSLAIRILAPEKYFGYTLVPGTKGYRDYVQAAIDDWAKNASLYETYVDWPVEREMLEKAIKAARANIPERLNPVDKDGNPVEAPNAPKSGSDVGTYVVIGLVGLTLIGAGMYFAKKEKKLP